MRVVFTKYREEVTSVKRSVTRVGVETSGRGPEGAGHPVIELVPEAAVTDRARPVFGAAPCVQPKEAVFALSARAHEVADVVDLHDPSTHATVNEGTYSLAGALRADIRSLTGGEKEEKPEGEPFHARSWALHGPMAGVPRPISEARPAGCDVRIRRFIAVQELNGHRVSPARKPGIEIEV